MFYATTRSPLAKRQGTQLQKRACFGFPLITPLVRVFRIYVPLIVDQTGLDILQAVRFLSDVLESIDGHMSSIEKPNGLLRADLPVCVRVFRLWVAFIFQQYVTVSFYTCCVTRAMMTDRGDSIVFRSITTGNDVTRAYEPVTFTCAPSLSAANFYENPWQAETASGCVAGSHIVSITSASFCFLLFIAINKPLNCGPRRLRALER